MADEDDNNSIEEQDEGMSTPKKVAAGAAIGVAIPAAVGVAKKLIGNGDSEEEASEEAGAQEESGAAEPTRRRVSSRARSTASRGGRTARSSRAPARSTGSR